MTFLERLGAFAGKRLAEKGVAIGQGHHKEGDFPHLSAIDDRGLAEIGLRLPVRCASGMKTSADRCLMRRTSSQQP